MYVWESQHYQLRRLVCVRACVRVCMCALWRAAAGWRARAHTHTVTGNIWGYILTFKVFLLRTADFMCGGFAHSLADSRPGHAVLRRCDTIRDRLARHCFCFSLSLLLPQSAKNKKSTMTIRLIDQLPASKIWNVKKRYTYCFMFVWGFLLLNSRCGQNLCSLVSSNVRSLVAQKMQVQEYVALKRREKKTQSRADLQFPFEVKLLGKYPHYLSI